MKRNVISLSDHVMFFYFLNTYKKTKYIFFAAIEMTFYVTMAMVTVSFHV